MHILKSYDDLPYTDCPIAESRPDHLAVIGRLFGIETPSAENARVLEFGCTSGSNLIPLAYHWPNCEFTGIEISRHQVQQGQETIEQLGLANIKLIHAGILDIDTKFGLFDYIIAHGVYSWMPDEVQQQLLYLCKNLLGPNGIAYISYNTHRGWPISRFMEQADRNGLQYISEACLYTMLESSLIPQPARNLEQFDNIIDYEQYMDFYFLKHFRQSLLCHAAHEIDREIEISKLDNMFLYGDLTTVEEVNLHSTQAQAFTSQSGDVFKIKHPLTKAALIDLAMLYPKTCSLNELTSQAKLYLKEYGDSSFIHEINELPYELLNLYLSQAIGISSVRRNTAAEISDTPKLNELTRIAIRQAKPCVASVHHNSIAIDLLNQYVLSRMDGTNSIEDIGNQVLEIAEKDDELAKYLNSKGIVLPGDKAKLLSHINSLFYFFTSHGLLAGT